MQIAVPALALTSLLAISGCSGSNGRQTRLYQAGEKATVDRLTYSVVDTQILPRLGDDPNNPRIPRNRFYVVQIAVFNAGNSEASIPPLTLVDDSGQEYDELPDGAGVPRWLGVLRKVGPGQTESGNILFDAPASHFRLRLTDDTVENAVFADLPLNFVHEQMNDVVLPDPGQRLPDPGIAGQKK